MENAIKQEQKKPTLEITLESLGNIERDIGQLIILEEHWTDNNLDRRQQLDYAKIIYKRIQDEIRAALRTSPHYSTV